MSRLSELIAELCPDGVEYRAFSEVCTYVRGVTFSKAQQSDDKSDRPVLRANNIDLLTNSLCLDEVIYIDDTVTVRSNQFLKTGDVFICAGSGSKEHVGKVAYIDSDTHYAFGGFMAVVRTKAVGLNQKYLYYFLTSEAFAKHRRKKLQSSTINNLNAGIMASLTIPVPTIEVQREVVRILDEYTAAHDELNQRHLDERGLLRAQAVALCDKLICRDEFERKAIGTLGTLTRGKRFTASDYVEEGIPSIHYGEVYTEYGVSASRTVSHVRGEMRDRLRYAEPGDVIVACTGENKDDICKPVAWLGEEKVAVHDDCHIFRHDMDPRYVAYALMTTEFHEQKKQAANESKVVRVSGKRLAAMKIPAPSIERQREIADVLDRVYSLTDQLGEVLMSETELIRSDVQEFRNHLLSFPEKVS